MGRITVITIGTGNENELTLASLKALQNAPQLVLRTERHPLTKMLREKGITFSSLDELYDQAESFDELNRLGAKRLKVLSETGRLCYAVSDSLTDTILRELRADPEVELEILPGVSHADRCLALLGEDVSAVQLCSAEGFQGIEYVPSSSLLLTELHSRECAGECKLKLAKLMDEEATITLISGKEESGALHAAKIPLYEMDRQKHYDHLTAVFVKGLPWRERSRYSIGDFVKVVEQLRSPNGCPWDREQTHESLLRNLLEESYEYIQAVHEEDTEHMTEELGDVLLQVVLHSVIADQCGEFDFADVTTAICQKMIDRHPHVFGGEQVSGTEEQLLRWEKRKCAQRGIRTYTEAMQAVSTALSPLLRSSKVQNKVHSIGFDFADPTEALQKVYEEADEVKDNLQKHEAPEEELGDLLFSVVNVCRLAGVDADIALQFATEKFIRRFSQLESAVLRDGKQLDQLTLDEMNEYWEVSKRAEQDS